MIHPKEHIQIRQNKVFTNHDTYRVLFISTYPSRECGLATFSKDLIESIKDKFHQSCEIDVCAIDLSEAQTAYTFPVKYVLHADKRQQYSAFAQQLNKEKNYDCIFLQHEFGLFRGDYGSFILDFLKDIKIPVITTFHTILPNPTLERKNVVQGLIYHSSGIVCMTKDSAKILIDSYGCPVTKITIIPHGTHLLSLKSADKLKQKFGFPGRKTVSTFGLLSSGKSIETGLYSIAKIKEAHPEILYLIIGKTHPEIIKHEGEKYRAKLESLIQELNIQDQVIFVNEFVERTKLQEYLQATDIYLFTSNDPFQAVSGTFSYAMACGCPIISTRIPQAEDMLGSAGILVDFNAPEQMSIAIDSLLKDDERLKEMKRNALQQIRPSAWQNVAIQHMELIKNHSEKELDTIQYSIPDYNLSHFFNTTNEIGIVQFSQAESPQLSSGYTVDDNARALIALVEYYELTKDLRVLTLIETHFNFLINMQQSNGAFFNYRNQAGKLTDQNYQEDLDDANGRAIWAFGYLFSKNVLFQGIYFEKIKQVISKVEAKIHTMKSPRAISFSIKGLVHYNSVLKSPEMDQLTIELADRLISLFEQNKQEDHPWFESKITYANSVIPEALLYAYRISGIKHFKTVAIKSFDYLCSILFQPEHFRVISNQTWYEPGKISAIEGEQPIDVAYTIIALSEFYVCFGNYDYLTRMTRAFEWYLGRNQLNQIVYNPISGGCLDGIEAKQVNINQGAEATTTYLMARNRMEKHQRQKDQEQTTQLIMNTHNNFKITTPYAQDRNFTRTKS
jgi:glycosyltransferase involved in cell wall biosynthesis